MRIERTIIIDQPQQRAIDALALAVPTVSRQALKQAMDKGAVWLKSRKGKGNRRLRRATKQLNPPQTLVLFYDDKLLAIQPPTPNLLADCEEYSVWNKPAGLLAQGTHFGDHCSLLRISEKAFNPQRESFLIHRLDRDANGIMLIAHTKKAAAKLSELFQLNKITKRYKVRVEGIINETNSIETPINKKPAKTIIENIICTNVDSNTTDLMVRIETGRKHQIRRHFSDLGFPVVGDYKYGAINKTDNLQLTAVELSFVCPLTNVERNFNLLD